jgi:hypothetical protein
MGQTEMSEAEGGVQGALQVTYSGEAWEYVLAIVQDYVDRGLTVRINGTDITLTRMDGGDDHEVIVGHPWRKGEAGDEELVDQEIRIPVFVNHYFAIDTIHVY